MKNLKVKAGSLLAMVVGLVVAGAANAGGGGGLDYGTLTDAINVDDVGPAILQAAGALIGMYLVIVAVRKIIGFVKGA